MSNAIQVYGTSEEIMRMAKRFKTALRGGDKLNENEVVALAQIAKITGLNPFIGELWYIPGKGPMIGIAGARRTWNEQSAKGGGWSHIEIIPTSADEVGYTGDVKDLAAAFRAEAHDSGATAQYQKLFTETIVAMRAAGSADPFADAKQICGPRPMWVGFGYSTMSETSRMNKTQLARKRAEADALKKCINVPFGVDVSAEYETAPNATKINADAVPGEIIDPQLQAGEENQDGETTETTELVIESQIPSPAKKELVADADWQAFGKLVQQAENKGIKLPEYKRAEMTPAQVHGATEYIKGKLK